MFQLMSPMFLIVLFVHLIVPFMIMVNNFKKKLRGRNPPGPPGLPFIGNMLQFDKSESHIYLWELSKKYGPLAFLKKGFTPMLVVSSAEMAKEILKTHDLSFCCRPSVVGQQKLSYGAKDIAFSPYNHRWKELRRICVHHVFSSKAVLSFQPIREDEVSRMIARVSTLSSSSQPVNLSHLAMSLAVNLICRTAFGRRYEDDEYDRIKFDRLIANIQDLMVSFYVADHFPHPLSWIDKVRGISDRLHSTFGEMDAFYQQIIEEHLNPSRGSKEDQRVEDVVDLMIRLKKEQESSSVDLTWDHIKALLMNLFVAGSDPVAASIVWTMTTLTLRPKIMNKTQTEIRKVIGTKGIVNEGDLEKLPYLKAVVQEILRLYPPAPILHRTQISQHECTVGGYKISPGTSVVINGWTIGRDPSIWKDPEEFLPERFLQDNNIITKRAGEFEMIPFGGGRRGCPGREMGMISMELALANLLYSFDWSLPPLADEDGIDMESLPGLTTHKKNALVLMAVKNYNN